MGVVHCMNVDEKLDTFDGLLEQHALSCEIANQPSSILARIDRNLMALEHDPKELIETKPFPHEKTIDNSLARAEKELDEIEKNVKLFVEELASYRKIIRKIDLLLGSWKIDRKKVSIEDKPFATTSVIFNICSETKRLKCFLEGLF